MKNSFSISQPSDYQQSFHSTLTGKEKDSESGYYYFGARYFMPNLSIWNSVDPMADKYPSLSPYNYCAWNPLKLVDPNGLDTFNIILDKGTISAQPADGDHFIRFWRDKEIISSMAVSKDINVEFNFDIWRVNDKEGYTYYLNFSDATIGKNVFDIIANDGYNNSSTFEWDYYPTMTSGELSTSGEVDMMVHAVNKHTDNSIEWHHFHPNNSDKSWFPSFSDQNNARQLGIPCYLYSNGGCWRFDEVVRSRNLNPSEYGRIFHLCN